MLSPHYSHQTHLFIARYTTPRLLAVLSFGNKRRPRFSPQFTYPTISLFTLQPSPSNYSLHFHSGCVISSGADVNRCSLLSVIPQLWFGGGEWGANTSQSILEPKRENPDSPTPRGYIQKYNHKLKTRDGHEVLVLWFVPISRRDTIE